MHSIIFYAFYLHLYDNDRSLIQYFHITSMAMYMSFIIAAIVIVQTCMHKKLASYIVSISYTYKA